MEFIILAVIILGIVAANQLFKIYELSKELRPNEAEVITEADSRFNARMGIVFMIAFFAFCIWSTLKWKHNFLPVAASKHGVEIDSLMNVTWIIIGIPFVVCNFLLFFFVNKYYFRKNRKADFFAHSNKLEAVWTVVPAIVLATLIVYGLTVWNNVVNYTSVAENENPVKIELYAKQFDWTARYAGEDGKLGDADFRMINVTNPLGLISPESVGTRLHELDSLIAQAEVDIKAQMALEGKIFGPVEADPHAEPQGHGHHDGAPEPNKQPAHGEEHKADGGHGGHHEDPYAGASKVVRKMADELEHLKRMRAAIAGFVRGKVSSGDDKLVKGEFHIPVNRPVVFQFRSQDVIHSAFMPHFRAQMNCVPGMKTYFSFLPTITTAEMRKNTNNPKFDYYLLCNKICGNSHFNMKMVIIVESEADYNAWLKGQKTFKGEPAAGGTQTTLEGAGATAPTDSAQVTKKDSVTTAGNHKD